MSDPSTVWRKPTRIGRRHRNRSRKNKGSEENGDTTAESNKEKKTGSLTFLHPIRLKLNLSYWVRFFIFSPSRMIDWFQLELDLTQFFGSLRLKVWFNQQHKPSYAIDITKLQFMNFDLSIKSDFNPTVTSNAIETFVSLAKKDLNILKVEIVGSIRYHNIMSEEICALKEELSQNQDTTIKPADKGVG